MGVDHRFRLNSTMPLELGRPLPRKVCLTTEGIWRVSAATVLLLIAFVWVLLIMVGSLHQKEHYAELGKEGRHMIATIDRIDGSGVYYSFTSNGVIFTGKSSIPGGLRSQLQILGPLSILYLPSNPRVNRPADWDETAIQGLGILVLPILVAALGLWMVLNLRATRRIIRNGVAVAGIVQRCNRYNRTGEVTVTYEFSTSQDSKKEGRGWSQESLPEGTQIWVIYLPLNPNVSTSYPLHHWRAVL